MTFKFVRNSNISVVENIAESNAVPSQLKITIRPSSGGQAATPAQQPSRSAKANQAPSRVQPSRTNKANKMAKILDGMEVDDDAITSLPGRRKRRIEDEPEQFFTVPDDAGRNLMAPVKRRKQAVSVQPLDIPPQLLLIQIRFLLVKAFNPKSSHLQCHSQLQILVLKYNASLSPSKLMKPSIRVNQLNFTRNVSLCYSKLVESSTSRLSNLIHKHGARPRPSQIMKSSISPSDLNQKCNARLHSSKLVKPSINRLLLARLRSSKLVKPSINRLPLARLHLSKLVKLSISRLPRARLHLSKLVKLSIDRLPRANLRLFKLVKLSINWLIITKLNLVILKLTLTSLN